MVVRKPVSLSTQLFHFHSADRDFEPPCEEEDDEETIEVEEQQEGNDAESHRREIELLKEEGNLPLDQLLSTLKLPQVPQQSPLGMLSECRRPLSSVKGALCKKE